MSPEEWRACAEPDLLLASLHGRASPRQAHLFACACCRRFAHLLTRRAVCEALEVAERFADGQATQDELLSARQAVRKALSMAPLRTHWEEALHALLHALAGQLSGWPVAWAAARARALEDEPARRGSDVGDGSLAERAAQCDILRDLFGPTGARPAPRWSPPLGGEAEAIARAIYQERRFEDLPVLADALEEAGCAEPMVLEHCRRRGLHVRGCWVIERFFEAAGKPP